MTSTLNRQNAKANAVKIYRDKILPRYRKTHHGRVVVIDGVSGDYAFAGDRMVINRMRERHPHAVIHMHKIGEPLPAND